MKKIYFILIISTLLMHDALAQSSIIQSSAANEGLAHTSSTLSNYGSIYSNVAGLGNIKTIGIATSYRIVPNALWQNTVSISGVIPFKIGTVGLSVTQLGDKLYNQQLASIGFANRFGIASIGIKANLLQYNIEGYGSKSIPYFEIGGVVELTPQLFIGAYIVNFTQSRLASFENEHFPTIIDAGISYRPTNKLMLNIEVEQDIDFDPTFKAGIEYKPIKNLSLRTGINSSPDRQYFGIGFIPKNILLNLDYALSHDIYSGIAHQLSLFYIIRASGK